MDVNTGEDENGEKGAPTGGTALAPTYSLPITNTRSRSGCDGKSSTYGTLVPGSATYLVVPVEHAHGQTWRKADRSMHATHRIVPPVQLWWKLTAKGDQLSTRKGAADVTGVSVVKRVPPSRTI